MKLRIGQGIDLHPFTGDKALVLGGVQIPHSEGLKGHSDADALTHAVCDALLGAANLGDIGQHFSDTEPKHKNQNSQVFLSAVMAMLRQNGWELINLDSTVLTESPMLKDHIAAMKSTLASTMGISPEQVSIKATRPEKMGALGRKEGLMALATVLLCQNP